MRKILAIGVVLLSVSSCYYDNSEELYPVDPSLCKTDSMTYEANTKAIFAKSCAVSGCHVVGAQLPVLETYADVLKSIKRIEQRALIEKSMPPAGPLGSCEQSQLTQWIADGYPEK